MKRRASTFALLAWIAAVATNAVLLQDAAMARAPISGVPIIVDGDTIWIGDTKIRLEGIDAPESDQTCLDAAGKSWTCGLASRDELLRKTANLSWTCRASGTDRYRRILATCEVGGEDIQRWMVRNGWALSFVRYSHAYDADEAAAKSNKAGLWAGAFVAPWDWRSRNARTVVLGSVMVPISAQSTLLSHSLSQTPVTLDCAIKGNLNRKGECIFHMPGSRYYNAVRMDLEKGKRWFCSPAEAEAAGCRAAKQP